MDKRYGDIVRIAMKSKENATRRPLSIRDVANATGFSYEHVRRAVSGQPTVSQDFNERVCHLLGLDVDIMWQKAQLEKVRRRFDLMPSALAGGFTSQRVQDLWNRLSPESERKALRIIENLAEADDLDVARQTVVRQTAG